MATGAPFRRGFLVPASDVRGSHCGAAAFEALSCGRDRVRWPVPLGNSGRGGPAVEPGISDVRMYFGSWNEWSRIFPSRPDSRDWGSNGP